jgi:hypothetical protein
VTSREYPLVVVSDTDRAELDHTVTWPPAPPRHLGFT